MGCCDRSVTFIKQSTTNPKDLFTQKQIQRSHGDCVRDNVHNIRLKKEGDRNVDQWSVLDHVTTNAHSFQGKAQLHIFEDNEAVIKMIIKGRSPMMRHVFRTYRVALDWLLDRINLEPKDPTSNMLTPKTNLRPCQPKVVSRMMRLTL